MNRCGPGSALGPLDRSRNAKRRLGSDRRRKIFDNLGGFNDMAASEGTHALDPSEYIAHHLQNLSTNAQTSIFDIHVWNLDTLFWSIVCGVVTIIVLGLAAR